ncbi:MAG: HD domain-containing protein [Bacteroidales bacterium]|nr:HD domain-containing protein [Bacteroidales bacterium]
MTQNLQYIIQEARKAVLLSFNSGWATKLKYHDYQHTVQVVDDALILAEKCHLSPTEKFIIEISALFHDMGYSDSYDEHEKISSEMAAVFLQQHQLPDAIIEQVTLCICSTRVPQTPKDIVSQLLCDADLAYLGKSGFISNLDKLRVEWKELLRINGNQIDFYQNTLSFCEKHRYFTACAREEFDVVKSQNITELKKLIQSLLNNLHF